MNERTGTIVLGHDVKISPITIAHGALSKKLSDNEEKNQTLAPVEGTTIGDLVKTLNDLVAPQI